MLHREFEIGHARHDIAAARIRILIGPTAHQKQRQVAAGQRKLKLSSRFAYAAPVQSLFQSGGPPPADATLTGPVADLYLRLQGRARPTVVAEGDNALVDHWFTGLQF